MKTTPTIRHFLAALGGSIIAITSAQAQLYWDTDGGTTGFGTASGTWGTDAFWNNDGTGGAGTFTSLTSNSTALNFGNGATGLAAGTINVGTVDAGSLTYATGTEAILLSGGSINFGAAATITNSSAVNQIISSTITGAGTSLTKSGTTVRLSAINSSYIGKTIITGILEVSKLANGDSPSSIGASGNANANLQINSLSTLRYVGNGDSTDRLIFSNASSSGNRFINLDASGNGAIQFTNSGNLTFPSGALARDLNLLGNSTHDNTLGFSLNNVNGGSGALDITKSGTGTWILTGTNTNTRTNSARTFRVDEGLLIFRGKQSIENAGVLEFSKPTAAANATARFESDTSFSMPLSGIRVWQESGRNGGNLVLDRQTPGNADTLTFTFSNPALGSSQVKSSTTLDVSAGTKITSGTPTLDFSQTLQLSDSGGTHTITPTGVNIRINAMTTSGGTKTLNLKGDRTGNEIYGAIDDGAGALSIVKQDGGTWTFSGANDYAGTTTVSGGTLALGADNTVPDVSNVSIGAATLRVNDSVNDTAGTLDVTAAATINLGSGATLAFADSSAVSWSGGTLTLTGTLDFSGTATSSLRFGTGNTALTSGPGSQLAAIFAVGFTNFRLNDSGYLIADSEGGSLYESWAGPGVAFDGDANGDGVKNGLAFLLGALSPTSAVTVPTVTQTSGNLVLNFNMLKLANRGTATLSVQHSRDLGIDDPWTTVLVTDTNSGPTGGVTFGVGSGAGTTNPVTATISASEAGGTGKLFGRLKAVP